MRILLRILVVLVLILSAVSLGLGTVVFSQREQMKARLNTLEANIRQMAREIEGEQADDLASRRLKPVEVNAIDLKKFYAIGPDGKIKTTIDAQGKTVKVTKGPGTMTQELADLLAAAQAQTKQLDNTRVELTNTRDDLAEKKAKLQQSRIKIATLDTKIELLEGNRDELQAQVAKLEIELEVKAEQINDLGAELADLSVKITNLEDKLFERDEQVAAQAKHIEALEAEIARKEDKTKEGGPAGGDTLEGLKGTISKVNAKYNFVVINASSQHKLKPGVTLLVQRSNKFIGKVKVRQVTFESNTIVADIMNEWMQKPMQRGDQVFYYVSN